METLINLGNKIIASDQSITPSNYTTASVFTRSDLTTPNTAGKLKNILPFSTFFSVQRGTSKWVLGPNGLFIEYADNEPAIEFNADGSYKGVLVEPSSTNEVLYSNEFSNDWWRKYNVTVSSESNLKFDTVWELRDSNDASNIYHFLGRISNITTTSNSYSRSIFLKKGTHKKVIVNTTGAFSPDVSTSINGRVLVDLDLGAIIDSRNADNIELQNYGGGWYRLSFARDAVSDIDRRFSIVMCQDTATDAINDQTYTGDGTGTIYIANAQLEESPIATSYIPTTVGTVTRAADDIYITGASSLIGQTEGTLFVEVDWRLADGVRQFLIDINSSVTTNDRVFIRIDDNDFIRFQVDTDSSAGRVVDTTQSADLSGIYKLAFAYKSTDSKIAINGTSIDPTSDFSFSFTNNLSDINLGQNYVETQQANMHIRTVAIYKTRLSDAECEAITTL